ncbi:MAG: hypothetical protein CR991_11540 [Proteobacteria bacterium]|nr:MAG: hypothetical protein CR991_11540 [Pseudomonadota bacterium]
MEKKLPLMELIVQKAVNFWTFPSLKSLQSDSLLNLSQNFQIIFFFQLLRLLKPGLWVQAKHKEEFWQLMELVFSLKKKSEK